MSNKRRVFQVAREFNVSIEALTTFLEKKNFKISSRMSPITDDMYEEIAKEFSHDSKVVTKKYDIKKELQEKHAIEAARKEQELLEYQKRLEISTKVMTEGLLRKKKPVKPEKQAKKILPVDMDSKVEKVLVDTDSTAPVAEKELEKTVADKIEERKAPAIKHKKFEPRTEKAAAAEAKKGEGKKQPEKAKPVEKQVEAKKKKLKRKERIKAGRETSETSAAEVKKPKVKMKRVERPGEAKTKDRPKKKSKKRKKFVISEEEVEQSIRQTFAAMEEASRHKRRKKKTKDVEAVEDVDENLLKVNEFITVGELADEMGVESNEVIKKCIELGLLVTINQRLDKETLEIVADEFGYKVDIVPEFGSELLEDIEEEDEDVSKMKPKPPVVTIMGHVDHGKTSLLDYVRKSNIIDSESGGITQHIGAYRVNVNSKMITFLDTPGHEAFTAMRARGAQATDIVVLIVAADDSVMPQTLEAIDHARAAEVPIVVAINKIDKPNANVEKIKKQLSEHGVLIEQWGGKHQCVEISAITGKNIDKLLDSILLEADMLELKENYDRLARGVVIESKLDKGKGVMATVLVQKGTLHIGDPFIVGQYHGKVRSMFDELGRKQKQAGPSDPVLVTGFTGLPQAGDKFIVLESERDAREISLKRQQLRREQDHRHFHHLTLDEISQQIKRGAVKELSLILKADVDGSVEALNDSLLKLSNEEVTVKVILKGVGGISESDVLLASASNAIIIGFQVRPSIKAREIAKKESVNIRIYRVIYDAISDVHAALEGLLEPSIEEENLGTLEVRDVFKVPKVGLAAGCYVASGKITRNDLIRLYRDDKLMYEGKISSLKRFKEDVKEVTSGFECGVALANFNDIKVGDILEVYKTVEVKRHLAVN
ncbi:MAG TPA: translation initiation factor IF-2 [bacterium]|nr:translation initiation factor IF-2 [bacterium]